MASTDLNMLKDMGFDAEKAGMGLAKGGNLQGAIDWLEKNQDRSLADLKSQETDATNDEDPDAPQLQPGETAKSLICRECNKKFRSTAQAEFHASKTEHSNFEESTEEIAPLTEAEKAAKLAELRQRATERKALQADADKVNARRNEEINRKKTREMQDLKEELAKKEQIKAAQAKRKEKDADVEAKRKIKAQIEEDREARRVKAEKEKALRAGQPQGVSEQPVATTPVNTTAVKSSELGYASARLKLQLPSGLALQKTFAVEMTLAGVAREIEAEAGFEITSFVQTYPKKIYERSAMDISLKDAGLVPSAALQVK